MNGEMLVVPDASLDPRFSSSPLVTGEPHIRFYAGQPLYSNGQAVGTLCLIDRQPRAFSDEQRAVLRDLAGLVEEELHRVKLAAERIMSEQALKSANTGLEQRFAALRAEYEERLVEASQRQSEDLRTRQQLQEKEELLDAILESIEVAVVACDAAGNLALFNRTARGFHGLDMKVVPPSEWPNYYSLFHADGQTPMTPDEVPLLRALKGEVVRDQAIVIAPAGRPAHTLLASGRPLRSSQGRSLGAVVAMKDITELNASKEQLMDSERRLRAVTENIPALVGKVDAQGKFVFLNGRAMRFYGKPAEQLIGHDVRSAYSDEEYAKIGPAIARARGGERAYFEDTITIHGKKLHYQCLFVPQLAADGRPDGFYAMAFDITARKQSELAQAESEERLRTITDNVPVLIACLDQEGRYSFANAVHQSWLGQAPANIIGRTMLDAFGEDYYLQQKDALEQAWEGKASQCEHEIVRKKHTRIVHSTFLPHVRDGEVIGVVILTTDATASRMHERNLHTLAHTDALTALPNRRQFETALQNSVAASTLGRRSRALLYLDVDYFKRINDSHGHAVGDLVLVEFARRLKQAVRSSDLVARLAGDEFTVLLDEVHGPLDAELVAKKILAAMEPPFAIGSRFLRVTTTVGVCVAEGPIASTAAIAEVADRALYQAKEAGRNTYEILLLDGQDCAQA
jgi:diguanylate cyclase (GGDEF)-like protein/PAS domain S-box-containing protein